MNDAAAGRAGAFAGTQANVAATLLAYAGVRTGEVVVVLGWDGSLLSRAAAAAAGAHGRVVGLEITQGLDDSVHKVVCGPDLPSGPALNVLLREVRRLLRPGGRLAVAAWRDQPPLSPSIAAAGLSIMRTHDDDTAHFLVATRPADPVAASGT